MPLIYSPPGAASFPPFLPVAVLPCCLCISLRRTCLDVVAVWQRQEASLGYQVQWYQSGIQIEE